MDITGKVKFVGETETFGAGFRKRTLIIESQDRDYVNDYGFDAIKDNCDKLEGLSVGDEVTVHYNMGRAREYNGKWYANFSQVWKLDKQASASNPQPQPDATAADFEDETDEIPF